MKSSHELPTSFVWRGGLSTPGADSAFLCPIDDALQTMPLIISRDSFEMLFRAGELTALVASVACAIVPAIRDARRLARSVLVEVVEAAACPGGA